MADRPWPSVLIPSSEQWGLKNSSRSGGQSFTGAEQVVMSPAARWAASLTIPCNNREKILALRSATLLGRAQNWIIGPVEVTRAPWWIDPIYGTPVTYGIGARDAAVDPAYETHPDTASTLDFRAASPAPMNATQMAVYRFRGGHLFPGQFFSIANRLYQIATLDSPDPTDPNTGLAVPEAIVISFRPWLRAPVSTGDAIEFGRPVSTMRLASDDTGALALQLSRLGPATLDLVEA
ncbi:hypothetical protein [Methylobacterium sp. 17Sr1-1]|uniref:hypothetical protein n=1 Tax=Methylobacterium sp. 17Sr1-1 TaxID=2202826 RepID=UPI000D6FA7AE|nr:hypothetical protein [Methylobacterium sp. 17Sr1-1]AWN51590.1 hypothetical protein DK412_07705 [Methylobacterium sp. 17Sr1-1]